MSKASKQQDKLINIQAQQLAATVANWAATLDFQKQRFSLLELPQFQQGMQLEVDKLAWQKAQDTWERAYQESLLTGTYQGQPTTQWLIDQAKLTGSYNGERTLEGKLTDAQIQDMHDKMKLANDEFLANTTGYINGQKTFDREKFEAAQGLEGWKFISTLTGPQNAFKQARAIATMPGGISDLMRGFAGQYMLPSGGAVGAGGAGGANPAGQLSDLMMSGGGAGGAAGAAPGGAAGAGAPGGAFISTGVNYGPAPGAGPATNMNLPYLQTPFAPFYDVPAQGTGQAAIDAWQAQHPGYAVDYSQPGGFRTVGTTPADFGMPATSTPGYTYSPPGAQAPTGAYNYSATQDGSVAVYPPGVTSPPQTADVSSTQPLNPAAVSQAVNQPYQYGGITAPAPDATSMTLPNQINAKNYSNMYQYQKDLGWAGYEDAGWDKGLAQDAFLKSLPTYGGPAKGSIAF